MEKILLLLHTENDNSLRKHSLEAVSAAQELAKKTSSEFVIGIIGQNAVSEDVLKCISGAGALKIYSVSGEDFGVSRYSTDAEAATAVIKNSGASIVIAPNTSRWARALPAAAFRSGGKIDTRVTGIISQGKISVQRWFYRQRMMVTLSRMHRPWIILLESGIYKPVESKSGAAPVEQIPVRLPDTEKKTVVIGIEDAVSGERTIIPDAQLLFVAGAGWMKKQADGAAHVKEAEAIIKLFLKQSNASLGSSKSLVDAAGEGAEVISFLTHMNQVGQTGSTPRHPKGLSTCCHGEEPHVVGWRFVNERRAINLDPNCGWAQGKADVLYVANAFEVIKKVNELLAKS